MPQLPLPLPDEADMRTRFDWLTAQMTFPNEPHFAHTVFTRKRLGHQCMNEDTDTEIKISIYDLSALVNGPGVDEIIKLHKKNIRKGETAGLILALIFLMDKAGIDRPSVNKAAHIIESRNKNNSRIGQPVKYYSDRSDISKAWNEMRHVSHIWASIELLDLLMDIYNFENGEAGWSAFLRTAAALRQFGCSFEESNTKNSKKLLDPVNSLALPDFYESSPMEFDSIPVPTWMNQMLSEYRAPERR
jgi:hypothetical protein